MHFTAVLVLMVAMVTNVQPRPPHSVIDFHNNRAHPWSIDEDIDTISSVAPCEESLGYFHDGPLPRDKLGLTYVYPKTQEGFLTADLSVLNNVYWWRKCYGSSAVKDVPYYQNEGKIYLSMHTVSASIRKRDYTTVQLVNMLKALAKTRRQRPIRINGKGPRFGISK